MQRHHRNGKTAGSDTFRPMHCEGWECAWKVGSASLWVDRLLVMVILASVCVMTVWLRTIVPARVQQIQHQDVTTAVRVRYAHELPFPAITICNMARTVALDSLYCGTYTNTSLCYPQQARDRMSNCISVNNDLNKTVYTTSKTGLADTLLVAVRLNTDQYPVSERFSGVHVSLHPQCSHARGECPEELSSVLVASPGRPRFYRMRRVTYVFLNGTQETQYEAQHGDAGAFQFRSQFGPESDTVVLGFHYSSLAETTIQELRPYTWLDLGAELGGILGLVFGIGVIPIFMDCVQWATRRQSMYYRLLGRRAREARRAEGGLEDDCGKGFGDMSGSSFDKSASINDTRSARARGLASDGAFVEAADPGFALHRRKTIKHGIGTEDWTHRSAGQSRAERHSSSFTSVRGPCAPLRVVLGIMCGCAPVRSGHQHDSAQGSEFGRDHRHSCTVSGDREQDDDDPSGPPGMLGHVSDSGNVAVRLWEASDGKTDTPAQEARERVSSTGSPGLGVSQDGSVHGAEGRTPASALLGSGTGNMPTDD